MVQQTGETRDAIMESSNKRIQEILDANKERRDPYWLVLFAKPARQSVEGLPTLIQHIKAYPVKPISQIGMVVGEVDPKKGTISWEVNMPQKPFDFNALLGKGAQACDEKVIETSTIPQAYLTQ